METCQQSCKHIKNIAVMLTTAIPVLAEDSDLFVESFDSVATNALPTSVKTEGSENTRVIEYGNRNKALCIDCAYSTNNKAFEFKKTSKNFTGLQTPVVDVNAHLLITKFPN